MPADLVCNHCAELKSRNKMILLLLFIYHWTLVVCQTYPNITFMDQNLPNNSYFDFSRVGRADNGSDSIHCHTDLENCCSMTEGPHHRGDWFFPNRSRLDFHLRLYESRGNDFPHVGGAVWAQNKSFSTHTAGSSRDPKRSDWSIDPCAPRFWHLAVSGV